MMNLTRHTCALAALPSEPAARVELIPVGGFRLADKRGQKAMRLDATDAAGVIATSLARATGGMLPIDFDHRSFAPQGSADSRAAGWITGMEVQGDRVMASVEWTEEGRRALEGRSYRFLSPVFKSWPDGRVALIEGAGLVNNPALPELRQLASKDEQMDPIETIAGVLGLSAGEPEKIVERVQALREAETQMASITRAAGVTGDDAVTQVCARLTATPAVDPSKYVPLSAFQDLQTQFASLQKTVGTDKAEAALQQARDAGKLTPAMEEWATQLASKDLAQFEAWAAAAPALVNLGTRTLAGREPPKKTAALDDTERHVASMMGISDEAFLASRNAAVKEG
ncbi:phage protease [Salipiger marinus]|uniref:phage protease n=1 Tax=Salipiger marinus TaxID=555512 RepID=UPI0040591CBA